MVMFVMFLQPPRADMWSEFSSFSGFYLAMTEWDSDVWRKRENLKERKKREKKKTNDTHTHRPQDPLSLLELFPAAVA
jgi:hypothetical protein